MKKRIHLHQLKIGMFVEELEEAQVPDKRSTAPFTVSSTADVDRVMHSNAMSLIINVRKGADVTRQVPSLSAHSSERLRIELLSKLLPEEAKQARATIEDTTPQIRQVLAQARFNKSLDMKAASPAVEQIMAAALNNTKALLTLARLKSRDEATFLHCLAVSALMVTLGRSLGLGEDDVRLLGIGGLVHDIGKMVLPLHILQKQGKLTSNEMTVIRTHPAEGHKILAKIEDIPPAVLDICLHHHEKYDGSGYPSNYSGELIPYVARIAAICDVYDALTSVRPYKQAWTQIEAIGMMSRSTGHFDEELLEVFMTKVIVTASV